MTMTLLWVDEGDKQVQDGVEAQQGDKKVEEEDASEEKLNLPDL